MAGRSTSTETSSGKQLKDMGNNPELNIPRIKEIERAWSNLDGVAFKTPLSLNHNISKIYDADIFLKREDLQIVRSYKIRGAFNKISSCFEEAKQNSVVCASAGNHAQGVALACKMLGIRGTIFMPTPTPSQKVQQVRMFGENQIEIILSGDTFDDSKIEAQRHSNSTGAIFIHPFDDPKIIEGQATVGLEILEQIEKPIDYLFMPVGGGGLAAGICTVFSKLSKNTRLIGVEPKGAPSMSKSLEKGEVIELDAINKFVDGAAVKRVGDLNFNICKSLIHDVVTVDEGKVCDTILKAYNKDAIVLEPAGALSIAVLSQFKNEIKGKTAVCILSGGNNDITRMEEIKEKAMLFNGLKHYFIVRFPQRAGALKEFVVDVLGPNDDITHFEYIKKTSRNTGSAVVGIELKSPNDFDPLVYRMKKLQFFGEY